MRIPQFDKAKASRALPAGGSTSTSSSTPSSSSASSKDSRRGPSKKPEPVKYNPLAKVSFSGLKKVGEASRQAHTFKEEKVSEWNFQICYNCTPEFYLSRPPVEFFPSLLKLNLNFSGFSWCSSPSRAVRNVSGDQRVIRHAPNLPQTDTQRVSAPFQVKKPPTN